MIFVQYRENNKEENILKLGHKYLENYKNRENGEEVKDKVKDSVLRVGRNPDYCPYCGSCERILIKGFIECHEECKFVARCPHCLYIYIFKSPSKFSLSIDYDIPCYCESCYSAFDLNKLKIELEKIIHPELIKKFKNLSD